MTTPPLPAPLNSGSVEAALHAAYADFVDDLRGRLDLTAGIEEATEPRSYQALTDDLAHGLDLERGLTVITGGPTPTRSRRRIEPIDDGTPADQPGSRHPARADRGRQRGKARPRDRGHESQDERPPQM